MGDEDPAERRLEVDEKPDDPDGHSDDPADGHTPIGVGVHTRSLPRPTGPIDAEALNGTPPAFSEDAVQGQRDPERKPDHAPKRFAENKGHDPDDKPDHSEAEPHDAHPAGSHDDRSVSPEGQK